MKPLPPLLVTALAAAASAVWWSLPGWPRLPRVVTLDSGSVKLSIMFNLGVVAVRGRLSVLSWQELVPPSWL